MTQQDIQSSGNRRGDVLTAISDGMVALLEEFCGRGPSRATGRQVIAFMSGNQQHPDLMCEVFILGPTDLVDDHEWGGASGGSGLNA
jgi:hypothetical protein